MSDYVTELRREVVGAHAAHRAGTARTRRRHRGPQLAWVVAAAALIVAAVLVVHFIPQPQPTSKPRVVKLLRLGGDPADGMLAGGSLWVADFGRSEVVRIDPARRKVIARIPIADGPEHLGAADGNVWASATTSNGQSVLWRIDRTTNRATGHFDAGYCMDLAVTPGRVWLARRDEDHSVDVFSSANGRRIARLPIQTPLGLTAAGGWVWVAAARGTVVRIGERSGRIEHRWPQLAPSNGDGGSSSIVADRSGAWVLDSAGGRLLRLEGDEVVRTLRIEETTQPIMAKAADGLWVVTSDDARASGIARIDPRTGKVTARVGLGNHYPRALVPSPEGLWVIAGDGTALLIDT
jgi:DNA-binding beta-propeller fold protein YncE